MSRCWSSGVDPGPSTRRGAASTRPAPSISGVVAHRRRYRSMVPRTWSIDSSYQDAVTRAPPRSAGGAPGAPRDWGARRECFAEPSGSTVAYAALGRPRTYAGWLIGQGHLPNPQQRGALEGLGDRVQRRAERRPGRPHRVLAVADADRHDLLEQRPEHRPLAADVGAADDRDPAADLGQHLLERRQDLDRGGGGGPRDGRLGGVQVGLRLVAHQVVAGLVELAVDQAERRVL